MDTIKRNTKFLDPIMEKRKISKLGEQKRLPSQRYRLPPDFCGILTNGVLSYQIVLPLEAINCVQLCHFLSGQRFMEDKDIKTAGVIL